VKDKRLIYDSEWCRIALVWGGWDYGSGNSISMYYGRLHAPNESATMIWNGEECHAWHDFDYALHLLDGRSPAQAANMKDSSLLTSKYYEDEYRQKFNRRQPEWLLTCTWRYGSITARVFLNCSIYDAPTCGSAIASS
jgi:hypothetical protein